MRRKVLGVVLVLLCSLALGASPEEPFEKVPSTCHEVWLVRQRISRTRNDGLRLGTDTYDGELVVAVENGIAKDFHMGGWGWPGDFTAAEQVWRDNTATKRHCIPFDGTNFVNLELMGWFRPNAKWTRLRGKWSGTATAFMEPAESYFYEARVTATYSHWVP